MDVFNFNFAVSIFSSQENKLMNKLELKLNLFQWNSCGSNASNIWRSIERFREESCFTKNRAREIEQALRQNPQAVRSYRIEHKYRIFGSLWISLIYLPQKTTFLPWSDMFRIKYLVEKNIM